MNLRAYRQFRIAKNASDLPLAGLKGEKRKVQWTFRRPETTAPKRISAKAGRVGVSGRDST